MTTTTAEPGARRGPFAADERLLQQHRVGPVDRLPAGGILALLPQLPESPMASAPRMTGMTRKPVSRRPEP